LDSENNPEDENGGVRKITFSKEIYIEQEDFMEVAPKKYFRLAPGQRVRLKSAYIIQCDEVVKDENGNITQVNCSYFANSKSGSDTSGVAVKSTIHWVNAANAIPVTIKEYDRLFSVENVDAQEGDFKEYVNPNSLSTITNALAEPALLEASLQHRFQFLRKGYFCMDEDSTPTNLVFNRTVTLKDSWAKEQKK
jgi:glutaminyl-tRNA synthetase